MNDSASPALPAPAARSRALTRAPGRRAPMLRLWASLFLLAYLAFALLPIYWMVVMSFKTNQGILSSFSLWPREFTLRNYAQIFTDPSWYNGYINSLIYVGLDRKSTRLNSSHVKNSYAVFCLKKK